MDKQFIFNFKTDISEIPIPGKLNNPFGLQIPEIANIAAREFQEYITSESQKWAHDFRVQKGKMFGVLVVQKEDNSYVYLATVSGKLLGGTTCINLIPSVLDDTEDDFFNKGMRGLTAIGNTIKQTDDQAKIIALTAQRKLKSFALQQRLFEHTQFLNVNGKAQNVLQIFEHSSHGTPPSAAGECAAPKLMQYALKHRLRPIAIAEFWWGNSPKNKAREHRNFYPACKNKCRPILEYMLDDMALYHQKT